jgi:transcriptional regulator with XRE-family HTH domain
MTGLAPARRRLIGSALRRYRENMGYQLDTAARILECDRSKVSRIETGQRGIRPSELRELMSEYGVPDGEQRVLLAIAETSRRLGWWQGYSDVLPPAAQDYILAETVASAIFVYEPQRVPDLLQTPDYAAAAAAAADLTRERRDRAVEVILTRQRHVLRERPARLHAVIGEAALRQPVGGPGVTRAQARLLAALADPPAASALADDSPAVGQDVIVQILPFNAGAQPGAGSGPLAVLRFEKAPSLGLVYLPTLNGGVCLEGEDDVACYVRAFARLQAAALTPAESARVLLDLAGG